MKSSTLQPRSRALFAPARRMRQRGVALFFALIALVAIMLAAVVLVRSVDTSTMIAGNLAFQQSATASGDGGTEAAITWLTGIEAANGAKNVLLDPSHAFNVDNAAAGYYASLDPAKSLTASSGTRFLWTNADSVGLAADSSGNTVRYIIQRMCAASGVAVSATNCLFSGAALDNNKQNIPLPQEICNGPGCPAAGQTPVIRVTSKITGPKNTQSYVQAFVY
jgi:type IV pilus assembly protein PilX